MADLPTQARVVIIGGGVGGCSIAYHLTLLGWKDVIILERHELTRFEALAPGDRKPPTAGQPDPGRRRRSHRDARVEARVAGPILAMHNPDL